MTELQVMLLMSAIAFLGGLYWWGKRSKDTNTTRRVQHDTLPASTPEEEGFEITVKPSRAQAMPSMVMSEVADSLVHQEPFREPTIHEKNIPLEDHTPHDVIQVGSRIQSSLSSKMLREDAQATADRMAHTQMMEFSDDVVPMMSMQEPPEIPAQIFALLVLAPTRQFSRIDIHIAMTAAGLQLSDHGIYIFVDGFGNGVFRIANVVEPGYFPAIDDTTFATPGVALVLELPSSVTPFRAMNEFITAARKISQNLGGHLYDAQRQLIRESHLKDMREYAQSITAMNS